MKVLLDVIAVLDGDQIQVFESLNQPLGWLAGHRLGDLVVIRATKNGDDAELVGSTVAVVLLEWQLRFERTSPGIQGLGARNRSRLRAGSKPFSLLARWWQKTPSA